MLNLPPVAPEVMFGISVRLPRHYSVDPAMIGRVMAVAASLDTVTVHKEGFLIGAHRRKWARQLTMTDPAHVARGADLRVQFQTQRARRAAVTEVVETEYLARYDELFGVDTDASPTVMAVMSRRAQKRPRRSSITPARCEHLGSVIRFGGSAIRPAMRAGPMRKILLRCSPRKNVKVKHRARALGSRRHGSSGT